MTDLHEMSWSDRQIQAILADPQIAKLDDGPAKTFLVELASFTGSYGHRSRLTAEHVPLTKSGHYDRTVPQ